MNLIFYDYAAILFSCLVCVCALLCFGVEFQRSVSLDPIFAVPAWLAPLKSPRFFEERPEIGRAECLLSTGYTFRNRSSVSAGFTVLTTVQGITSGPTGLQALCDLVVGSRPGLKEKRGVEKHTAWMDLGEKPRFVFVQVELIDDFCDKFLPCLSGPLVLIFGDHDATFPRQVDRRFPSPAISSAHWAQLLTDSRVSHMWATHLDSTEGGGKVSSLPVGLNPNEFPPDFDTNRILRQMHIPPSDLARRPLLALNCDRQRRAHVDRSWVLGWCLHEWSGLCVRRGLDKGAFMASIRNYTFLLAVQGGGIDPNPKAWMAIASGVIPIIRRFPGDSIYEGLPVAFVDSWNNDSLTLPQMLEWRSALSKYFDDPVKWDQVRERLTTDYWWGRVRASLAGGRQ